MSGEYCLRGFLQYVVPRCSIIRQGNERHAGLIGGERQSRTIAERAADQRRIVKQSPNETKWSQSFGDDFMRASRPPPSASFLCALCRSCEREKEHGKQAGRGGAPPPSFSGLVVPLVKNINVVENIGKTFAGAPATQPSLHVSATLPACMCRPHVSMTRELLISISARNCEAHEREYVIVSIQERIISSFLLMCQTPLRSLSLSLERA